MKKVYVLFFLFLLFSAAGFAQLVTIMPEDATTDSDITLIYDASLGNAALQGVQGEVYVFTGVITTESEGGWDWKYVRNDWGVVNPSALMTPMGNDLYQISFNIREFYGIPPGVEVLSLALLFHTADYSLVGRTAQGGDIFVEVNRQGPGNYLSHQVHDQQLAITADNGLFTVSYFNPLTVKVEFVPDGSSVIDTTFTVVATPHEVNATLSETPAALHYNSGQLLVAVEKTPLKVHFIQQGDTLLSETKGFSVAPTGGSVAFGITPGEAFYGGGSRALPVNRRGYRLRIYNEAHYGYENNTPTLNISIPMVVSSRQYGLFFDNRFPAVLDLGAENHNQLRYNTQGGRLRYYFMAGGEALSQVLQHYTFLTGRQPLPPLWSLGFIQSKFGYRNEQEAREMVNRLIGEGFPLDALVLDLYWFGAASDMGNLDWNYSQWSQPQEMMSDFLDQGVHTILITEPYVTTSSVNFQPLAGQDLLATDNQGHPYVIGGFWAGDAALIDLTLPAAQEWMWDFYEARVQQGVSGWWSDLGEPEAHPHDMIHAFGEASAIHNIYSLVWARFLFQKYRTHFPQQRLFNLIRSGFAGMQREATFPWSGDVQRSYSGLQAQVPLMLGAGLSGLGYMHSDVGGFVGGGSDSELFTRWVQFGVFAPVLRLHGVGTTEPVNFPEPYKSITREYIKWRYRLLPYNYTLAYENTLMGIPLARQLNFYEPENLALADVNDTYLWGRDLLIAPVLQPGATRRAVVFPQGQWLDVHTLTEYQGHNTYEVDLSLEQIPVFVRAGSFIPNARPMQSTMQYNSDSLVVHYYPDQQVPESSGSMFYDNGTTPGNLDSDAYQLLHFNGIFDSQQIEVTMSTSGNPLVAPGTERNMLYQIYRLAQAPELVQIEGATIASVQAPDDFSDHNPAWYWDADQKTLQVNLSWDGSQKTITIPGASLGPIDPIYEPEAVFLLHDPWPNPFSGQLNLKADIVTPGSYTISLQNAMGQVLFQQEARFMQPGRQSLVLPLQHLPSGIYLLSMQGNGHRQVKRVVKR